MADKVAYIGIGRMGGPMAMHLAKAGYDVAVHDVVMKKAEAFVAEHGGRLANTASEAAAGAVYVATCVGGDAESQDVTQGDTGAFRSMPKGAVFVDHNTMTAQAAEQTAETAATLGIHYMDAPVSGAEELAKAGELAVMMGGTEEGAAKAKAYLAAYSRTAEHIGPSGHGQLTKMVNQILISATMQGLAEGVVFARGSGLDLDKTFSLLSKGSAQSWWFDHRIQRMIDGELDPVDGGIDSLMTHLGLCLNEARRFGVALPISALIAQFNSAVHSRGRGSWESPALMTLWDERYFGMTPDDAITPDDESE